MALCFLAAGSNLGDRQKNLVEAQKLVEGLDETKVLRRSGIYETNPVGGPPQGKYLNSVWEIETGLSPSELIAALHRIEQHLGRVRAERNAPRTIDLDILTYGDEIIDEPGLIIPHPRLHQRAFVLQPLSELSAEWLHPILNKTVQELLKDCVKPHD